MGGQWPLLTFRGVMGRGSGAWARRALAAGGAASLALLVLLGLSHLVQASYSERIVPLARAPHAPVALVFGAGLAPGGVPSPVLAQRLDTAISLWRLGKVEALLVSGDNSDRFHDETQAMRRYVLERGVPAEAVLGDASGLSTYDSCVRAHGVFGAKRALLVTQRFHLPRALFIANSVGMDAWGVAADEGRASTRRYLLRETLSRVLALAMVLLRVEPAVPAGEPPTTSARR